MCLIIWGLQKVGVDWILQKRKVGDVGLIPNPGSGVFSVVALEDDLLFVPAELLHQQFAVGGDHVVQAADVGVHVGAFFERAREHDLFHVLLDIAALARPGVFGAANGDEVMEVGILSRHLLKLLAIVNVFGVA